MADLRLAGTRQLARPMLHVGSMPGDAATPAPCRVGDATLHDHLLHVYESDAECAATAAEFLAAGLRAGERCGFVGHPGLGAAVKEAMARGGVDVPAALARGALAFFESDLVYGTPAGVVGDPECLARLLEEAVGTARAAGYRGVRVASDAPVEALASRELVAREARIDPLVARWPVALLCHARLDAAEPEALLEMIRIHPLVVHGGRVLRNWEAAQADAPRPERPADALARVLRGLHAREAAAELVRREDERLRLILECAEHAYWEIEVATGAILAGDPWTVLGYPAPVNEASTAGWTALIHPDDQAAVLAAFDAHVEGRADRIRCEYRGRARDGSWRWVLVSGRAVSRDAGGRPERLAGTLTDVTDVRRLQERLQERDRLASVGRLAAGIAHEVNNPLAALLGSLRALEDHWAHAGACGPAERELAGAGRDAMDAAERVAAIVRGLQQFASHPREREAGRVSVAEELRAAIDVVRDDLAARARLELAVPDGLPDAIARRGELTQVFVNLLTNAAQAIAPGADTAVVSVDARASGGSVVVEVRDTGVGIPPERLGRIFDPFYTTRAVGEGTGLGLPICHGVVTAIGGRIDVESTPGAGTTFRVVLPCASPAGGRSASAGARRLRVLVVDDEPLVGRSVQRVLGSAHDVTVLTEGEGVLEQVAAGERWDVVLCDLMMPSMTGMDLEARLTVAAPELVPRIVYMTGGAFTERSRAFLEAGRPFMEKPIEPAALRARVAEVGARA